MEGIESVRPLGLTSRQVMYDVLNDQRIYLAEQWRKNDTFSNASNLHNVSYER